MSLMSFSGHKVYGPKAVGALYMRRRPRIRVEPHMNGGGHERGIRSGTAPTPLVVGFGAACKLAKKEMEGEPAVDELEVIKWLFEVEVLCSSSASLEPYYVLRALGVDEEMAHTSIRFGIGWFTTDEEIDKVVELTDRQVQKLRDMSPLWEMVQENIGIKKIQWSHN